MRTFAAILTSGTPAAINQLVVTQLYNPEGSAHTLAAFLLVQCKLGYNKPNYEGFKLIYRPRYASTVDYARRCWAVHFSTDIDGHRDLGR